MSYCTNCGTYIPIGEEKCPGCGTAAYFNAGTAYQSAPRTEPKQEQQTVYEARQEPKQNSQQTMQSWEPWKQGNSGSFTAAQSCSTAPTAGETADHRLSALCYVGPLFLFPLLMHKNDPFVRFHANQGLLLFLLETILLNLFDGLIGAAGLVFCMYCLVKGVKSAASGRRDRLPLIGNITLIR